MHSVGFLLTSDQPYVKTSTWQHTTLTTQRYPCPPAGFETRSPRKRAAVDKRLSPSGYWDRRTAPLSSYDPPFNISVLYAILLSDIPSTQTARSSKY